MVSRTIDKGFPMYFRIFFLKKTTVSGIWPNNRNYHLFIEIIKYYIFVPVRVIHRVGNRQENTVNPVIIIFN